MSDDPELETFLRQFRPTPPGPLRRPRRRGLPPWRFVALVAAVLVVVFAVTPGRRAPTPAKVAGARGLPTLAVLEGALRNGGYEVLLDQLDGHVLPDPVRPGSALSHLGDVSRDQ
jgi:hypothetical protein